LKRCCNAIETLGVSVLDYAVDAVLDRAAGGRSQLCSASVYLASHRITVWMLQLSILVGR
jgi:hypothetical protein